VETQAAFVGADGVVEFHPHPPVHLYRAVVALPGDAEHIDVFGLADALQDAVFFIDGVLLYELGLVAVARFHLR